ncbi:MAG: TetR/AcrR family transcriptional regulator [Bacillota bacterium]
MDTTNQKMTKRQMQAMISRKKIYDIAIDLFLNKGFDNVTIDDICKKAGVSKGAFYNYFKSKDQIVIEEFGKVDQYFEKSFKNIPANLSSLEKLLLFSRLSSKYISGIGIPMVKAVYYGEIGPGRNASLIIDENRALYKIIYSIVHEGQQKGEITTELSCKSIVDIIIRCSRGNIYQWLLDQGKESLESTANELFMVLVHGLAPREKASPSGIKSISYANRPDTPEKTIKATKKTKEHSA